MKALVLSRSKLRERSLQERFGYYQKLLRGRLSLTHELIKKGTLASHVPDGWVSIALEEHGDLVSSPQLAARIQKLERTGCTGVAFLIGDAAGFSEGDLQGVSGSISLSRLTFPHQLCFVLLAEQLYRATAINRGEKYHRGGVAG